VVARNRRDGHGDDGPLVVVDDVLDRFGGRSRAPRGRLAAKIVAVTGSVGRPRPRRRWRWPSPQAAKSTYRRRHFNNHGRTLSARPDGARARFGVFEIGMNHAGKSAGLVRMCSACGDHHGRRAGAS